MADANEDESEDPDDQDRALKAVHAHVASDSRPIMRRAKIARTMQHPRTAQPPKSASRRQLPVHEATFTPNRAETHFFGRAMRTEDPDARRDVANGILRAWGHSAHTHE